MNLEELRQSVLSYPFDIKEILLHKIQLKSYLQQQGSLLPKKIAILGGSTTVEIKNILELFLLDKGIEPEFYESEYNQYFEDVVFQNQALLDFQPDVIYIHTTCRNLLRVPHLSTSDALIQHYIEEERRRWRTMWEAIDQRFHCAVIQNNFELPDTHVLGNLGAVDPRSAVRFTRMLNEELARIAGEYKQIYIQDIAYLASVIGLEQWHDQGVWCTAKYAMSFDAFAVLAHNCASMMASIFGRVKKCLVLDLDHTLWGGVIGEDGLEGIQLGPETALGEAYMEFQRYVQQLKTKGVILAVCSKNDPDAAREAFNHPDSVLRLEDFSAFKANWQEKDDNIRAIARELNIGLDAIVFLDDNPVEQELVRAQLPQVEVPHYNGDVTGVIRLLDRHRWFETVSLSQEDQQRTQLYREEEQRRDESARYDSYQDFLASLNMKARIRPFESIYLNRITQLINKTNQFNLTTRRLTQAEVESMAADSGYITLQGHLEDRFGANGLVSLIMARQEDRDIHVDLWLMSCRVLKRDMERAMLDALVREAKSRDCQNIHGYYFKTPKNALVYNLYEQLGFQIISRTPEGDGTFRMNIPLEYSPQNHLIEVADEFSPSL
jgi:FkbH-like protein